MPHLERCVCLGVQVSLPIQQVMNEEHPTAQCLMTLHPPDMEPFATQNLKNEDIQLMIPTE